MNKEYIKALELEVRAYDKVYDELFKLGQRYKTKHEKKVKSKEDKLNQLLGDYKTEEDAHEAYGCEYITWEEYETICDALNGNAVKADVDDVEIVMSRIFYHLAKNTLQMYRSLKYDSLSDEEKAEWNMHVAEWNAKKEARKAKKEEAEKALKECE